MNRPSVATFACLSTPLRQRERVFRSRMLESHRVDQSAQHEPEQRTGCVCVQIGSHEVSAQPCDTGRKPEREERVHELPRRAFAQCSGDVASRYVRGAQEDQQHEGVSLIEPKQARSHDDCRAKEAQHGKASFGGFEGILASRALLQVEKRQRNGSGNEQADPKRFANRYKQ